MSRPRSGRAAKPAAAATPRARATAGRPGVYIQKPPNDIYVVMLSISLGAILLGTLLLALVMNRYEWKKTVSARTTVSTSVLV